MTANLVARVGYVVKRYPRFSETFIVQEILAHEAARLRIDIFALGGPEGGHFQDAIARVRGAVTYLPAAPPRGSDLWSDLAAIEREFPGAWAMLGENLMEDGRIIPAALALARAVRARGITHLHAHFATSATAVARLAAAIAGVPYTFTAHAKDIFHESVDDADLIRKAAEAACVVTISDFNRAFLQRRLGAAAGRIERVYNGLDLTEFPFSDPHERPATIIAVGRLVEKKGFDVLQDACAMLAARGVDFRCLIVGGGEEERALAAQASALGLGRWVRALGPLPRARVIELMQQSAVVAVPCVVGRDGNQDGIPTVILEALALGTPCVTTDVTGIPEAVIDGVTGAIVPQRDPEALANALARLLRDGVLRRRFARAGRAHVERLFDARATSAALRELFVGDRR
jgi:colanic acid/amylovoran biosynthesis glycosyltransferase